MGHGHLGVVGGGALAAIDTALWDFKAQALGRPLCDLLGGRVRDRVPYYAHVMDADTARAAVARGVRALKVGGTRQIVERAWAIREAIGPDVDLIVDLHGPAWLTGADAVAVGRAQEGTNLLFLEEPVAPDDALGWRRVRDSVALPLASGERLGTLAEFDQLIGSGLVDVVQPDTGRTGGPTQLKKIAALAEATQDEVIDANPLAGWNYQRNDAPKEEDDVDPFTAAEQQAILAEFTEEQERNVFRFAFWTGLRTSELIGLQWKDLDESRGLIRVQRARTRTADKDEDTKTTAGRRDVKLLGPALAALESQKAFTLLQGGAVFMNPRTGKAWTGDQVLWAAWGRAIRKAKVRYRRPY
ncbi:UNVERIFIED_CONTAM: tyrosine-type recombinase/integrase, partial [Microbacterium sp. SLM126]